jgi:crotonobetaine/carnitine-CoA ligase
MSIPGIENNIGTLLEKTASRYGENKAIHYDYEKLTFSYRELNARVNQFANALQAEGIKKGDHVAVILPNCPEFPVTWLALAKLGAVMIPINIRYQAVDLEYVLNDSDAIALVIHTEFASTFREAQPKTPGIKKVYRVGAGQEDLGSLLSELADAASNEFTTIDLSLGDLINIQYTSGTTGFPKGCMLTHEYWLTIGMSASENMDHDDVFLSVTPFYYMDPQWELIMCMTVGATMVLTRKYSASSYMKLINNYKVTVSWATMATWTLKQPESPYDKNHHLRYVIVGGFPAHLHKQFEERFNVCAREAYGMTEIGTGMMVPLEDDHMTGSGSVGKPPEYRTTKIIDKHGNLVKEGEIGELLIKGPGIFKGYYNKPEATAKAFEGDWFHTGDLVRQDENGYFYIIGRIKDMIRRTGDNISASEVENVLASHSKILSVAVVPVPDESRGEEVKAYICPKQGETPESIPPADIIAYCLDRIAEFKVPRYIEYVDEFSRTSSGKIQKHVLIGAKEDLASDCYDRMAEK